MFLITAILTIAMVSAADLTFTKLDNSEIFASSLTGTLSVDTAIDVKYSDDGTTIPTDVDFSDAPNVEVTTTSDFDKLDLGAHTGSLIITNGTETETKSVEFVNSFCELGAIDDSDLTLEVDIDNKGEGDDSDWLPRDTIEITVNFDNDQDEDVDDVIIELGLIEKSTGKNVADELDWISSDDEEADIGDVRDGKDTEHVFEFNVPNDISDTDYDLMIKAYPKGDEDVTCIDFSEDLNNDFYETIDVSRETDDQRQVIFEDITINAPIPCGEEATLTTKVYNIGSGEQEAVKVNLYNTDLGIDISEVFEKFDEDESKIIEFSFLIPEDAEEGSYTFRLLALYDYDEDEDEDNDDEINFEDEAFDEESDQEAFTFSIEGNCADSTIASALITAELDSETPEAVAGKQVIIKSTIKNTGTDATTYSVSVFGNSAWSSLSAIDPQVITLDPGESEDVSIFLDVDQEAAGEQEFTIKTTYGDETTEQRVALLVEEGVTQDVVIEHLRENWFIYLIALINIILIIAIIAVVKSMVGKSPSAR